VTWSDINVNGTGCENNNKQSILNAMADKLHNLFSLSKGSAWKHGAKIIITGTRTVRFRLSHSLNSL